MFAIRKCAVGALLMFTPVTAIMAQTAQIPPQTAVQLPSYARTARLVIGAPLIIDVRIRSADRLKPENSPGLASGRIRYLIEADVLALIRGRSALPTRISYLADVGVDSRGRPPKLSKQRVLLFARPIAGQPAQVQLTGLDSQQSWTGPYDAQVRGIVREVVASDAPPAVTGIGNAFHVPGSLPGEGETQIFLGTATGLPVSLQVLRRPDQPPRWSASLGEIVDDSAGAPAKDTLLWYRLACGLPRQLPDSAVAGEDPGNARAAREDYAVVLRDLGPCA